MSRAVALAQQLVRIDTAGHGEATAADLIEHRLARRGLRCERYELAPGRDSLVCRLPGRDPAAPTLCLTGHLDTVGVGSATWTHDAFAGDVDGDRLWGRGSADMKGGVAAMVIATEALANADSQAGVVLALCAAEETGAHGAVQIAGHLGPIGAIVVGEPTSSRLAIAHKGVAWIRLRSWGVAAHAATPDHGANAIEAMALAITRLSHLDIEAPPHPHLGTPTLNIGSISGGAAPNIVPDQCDAVVDVRLVPGLAADAAAAQVRDAVDGLAEVTVDLSVPAIGTPPDHPWIRQLLDLTGGEPCGVSYFTDASRLAPAAGDPPVAIFGPGDPSLAHRVDEWCSASAIDRAARIYEHIAANWSLGGPTT